MNKEVIAQLAAAARSGSTPDMTKEARAFGQFMTRTLGRPFTRTAMRAERLPAGFIGPPRQMPTRVFSPGRTAATAGVGLLGVGQLAHDPGDSWNPLRRSADITAGRTLNPWTWASPNSSQQAAQHATAHFNRLNTDLEGQIDAAYQQGDMDGAANLEEIQRNQSFSGGSNGFTRFLHSLNPFGSGSMATYGEAARGQMPTLERQLEAARRRLNARRANMSSEEVGRFEHNIGGLDSALQDVRRIPQIRQRMQQTASGGSGGSPEHTPAAPHWAFGNRPTNPAVVQGWALNPYDFRRDPSGRDVWEDVLARSGPARPTI